MMKFATQYSPCRVDGVSFKDAPSLTQSQFLPETDINALIRRAIGGDMSVFRRPEFLDVVSAPETFQDAANKTALARSIWENMPDEVRRTYGSPEALVLDFDRAVAAAEASKKDEVKKDEVKVGKTASSTDAPTPSNT